jgi:hypothetical protein
MIRRPEGPESKLSPPPSHMFSDASDCMNATSPCPCPGCEWQGATEHSGCRNSERPGGLSRSAAAPLDDTGHPSCRYRAIRSALSLSSRRTSWTRQVSPCCQRSWSPWSHWGRSAVAVGRDCGAQAMLSDAASNGLVTMDGNPSDRWRQNRHSRAGSYADTCRIPRTRTLRRAAVPMRRVPCRR